MFGGGCCILLLFVPVGEEGRLVYLGGGEEGC